MTGFILYVQLSYNACKQQKGSPQEKGLVLLWPVLSGHSRSLYRMLYSAPCRKEKPWHFQERHWPGTDYQFPNAFSLTASSVPVLRSLELGSWLDGLIVRNRFPGQSLKKKNTRCYPHIFGSKSRLLASELCFLTYKITWTQRNEPFLSQEG